LAKFRNSNYPYPIPLVLLFPVSVSYVPVPCFILLLHQDLPESSLTSRLPCLPTFNTLLFSLYFSGFSRLPSDFSSLTVPAGFCLFTMVITFTTFGSTLPFTFPFSPVHCFSSAWSFGFPLFPDSVVLPYWVMLIHPILPVSWWMFPITSEGSKAVSLWVSTLASFLVTWFPLFQVSLSSFQSPYRV